MKIWLLPLVIVLLASRALASGEVAVVYDELVVSSTHLGVRILVAEGGKEEKPKVQVSFKGEDLALDDYFLFGAKKIIKPSTRLILQLGGPTQNPADALAEQGFIVSFEFGNAEEPGEKDNPTLVHKVLRLHFSPGGGVWSELAIPKRDFSNEWLIEDRRKLGEPVDATELSLEGVKCPFSTSVEPR